MIRKTFILFLAALCLTVCETYAYIPLKAAKQKVECSGVIRCISDSDDITEFLPHITPNTLVVIDLDNTTMYSKTQYGTDQWYYRNIVMKEVDKGFTLDEAILRTYPQWVFAQQHNEVIPVDKRIPGIISDLQSKGVPILGLTSREPIVAIPTVKQLNSIGVDFSKSKLSDLKPSFSAPYSPAFYEGVIFVHDLNKKGEILDQFLAQIPEEELTIDKIVFIDDRMSHIENVMKYAEDRNCGFFGLRYSKSDEHVKGLNVAIAEKQLEILTKGLTDKDAEKLLQHPKGRQLLQSYTDPVSEDSKRDNTLTTLTESSQISPLEKHEIESLIIETDKITDILDIVSEHPLFVFDLNETLMATTNYLGSDQWVAELIQSHTENGKSKDEVLDSLIPLWHDILLSTPVNTVEPETAFVIRTLQKSQIPMIGLTARYVEMSYPTINQLKTLSLDFSNHAFTPHNFSLNTQYPSKFIDGVIFAGLKNRKDDAFVQFLQQNPIDFDTLVFVDDKMKNVEMMKSAAETLGKTYIGIWYRGAEKNLIGKDPRIAKIQKYAFNKTLSDELVSIIINE